MGCKPGDRASSASDRGISYLTQYTSAQIQVDESVGPDGPQWSTYQRVRSNGSTWFRRNTEDWTEEVEGPVGL